MKIGCCRRKLGVAHFVDRKIFSITLDNASYNETLADSLKENLSFGPYLPCSGEFVHVRCGAHVLNLIVQDGLKVIDEVVHNIRESVKYMKGSDSRRLKFAGCLAMLPFFTSKKVRQDVPTRWNSTYLMIDVSLKVLIPINWLINPRIFM